MAQGKVTDYAIETRWGWYQPAERIAQYSFPESFRDSFIGCKHWISETAARKILTQLRARGFDVNLVACDDGVPITA
jgi:hypothetical protein